MARTQPKPDFRKFAALQSEPAKGSRDPHRKTAPAPVDGAAEQRKPLTISQYQDPRDQLDHERHAMRAETLQDEEQALPEAKDA